MYTRMAICTALIALAGCERNDNDQNRNGRTMTPPPSSSPSTTTPTTPAPSSGERNPRNDNPSGGGSMNPTPAADPAGNPISGADPTGMPPGDARDAAITDQVKRIVESDTAISAEARRAVNVRTKDGVVTLEGTVPAQTDKEIIEAKASRLPAVAKVENKITVKAP